jgi:hypothetical protein
MNLAAWTISGEVQKVQEYQRTLQNYSPNPGEKEPGKLIIAPGTSGLAGVKANKLIAFKPLWKI